MTSKERELAIDIFEDNFTVIDTHGHYTEEEECLAIDMAIQALEQEPCEDAISRQAVINLISSYGGIDYRARQDMIKIIKKKPSVTPTHGKMLVCPNCGLDVHSDFENCPRCGAKMQKVK